MKHKFYIFDSDALKNFHKRIFFSIIVFASLYFLAVYRIADVMLINVIIDHKSYKKNHEVRGNIYDRNKNLLSGTIETYSLSVNANEIDNKIKISKELSKILNITESSIIKKLNTKKKFVWLKRNISPREHQKIIDLGEINLKTQKENKRLYPFGNISSHIVGYVDVDGNGRSGIERGMEKILASGKNIKLTIDINLQTAIREELLKSIEKFSADSGLAVVMNIKSGEILSSISYPDFNPNDNKTFNSNNLFNRVFQGNYEMGSTFKPITIALGIDKSIIAPDTIFDVSKPIKGIRDYHPFNGSMSVEEIVVQSSNIGTAKIAKKIGKEKQISFFKDIGFYEKIEIGIKEAAKPLGNKNNWGIKETMTIGFGHGFAVTPMHLINAYSAILNEGKKTNPSIVLSNKILNVKNIIKPETSKFLLKILRSVVTDTDYTGPRVEIDGYEIGGKTGTAELLNKQGRYDKDKNLTSFIGVFPISKPTYLVLTIIENPKKIKEENYNITGATVNAPLVKNIILKMIKILAIPKDQDKEFLNADISSLYNFSNVTF